LLSEKKKRSLARAAAVACLLVIVVLAATTFGSAQHDPSQVRVYCIASGGMAYNVYFLCCWTEALASGRRKETTWLIGGVWLLVFGVVFFVGLTLALATCSGGCFGGGIRLPDWLAMFSTWGIGLGFKGWLDAAHPGGPS
jgi:hypothetical protein